MKKIITRTIAWISNPSDAFVDGLLRLLTAVLKAGIVFALTIILANLVPALWLEYGDISTTEAQHVSALLFVLGTAATIITLGKVVNGPLRRPTFQYPTALTVGAAPWHREDHAPEALDMIVLHEARHAVIADVLGYTVTYIRTRPGAGNSGGRVSWVAPTDLAPVDRRWAEVLISLAPLGAVGNDPQTDDTQAMSHLMQIIIAGEKPASVTGALNLSDLFAEALEQTRELVEVNQHAIDRLVAVLLERRVMFSEELAEVMEAARITPTESFTADCHAPSAHSRTGSPT